MPIVSHNPSELFPPYRGYSHATEIRGDSRLLVISGLNGYLADGTTLPASFEEQGDLIWRYMGVLLRSADMDYRHLVSLHLSGRSRRRRGQRAAAPEVPGRASPLLDRGLLPSAGSALEA